ncbi:MAG TPA: hypothetical protein VMU54_09690 [Planctomycetota bacterium]|nr:hypothetical protein [Planctomycetota bacterium]
MRFQDTWLLTGAWVAMAAAGAFSLYKVAQTSRIDPTVARLVQDLEEAQTGRGPKPMPEPLPRIRLPDIDPRAGCFVPDEGSSRFHPKFRMIEIPHPVGDILVLPVPVMETAKADLDGACISWKTVLQDVERRSWMRPKEAKPSGFTVMRESPPGLPQAIAELGPAARSFADPSTEPRRTYHYWVVLKGLETDRSNDDGNLIPVAKKADRPASAKAPSAVRLKLVGGDKTHGVLRVETYDRAKKAWGGRTALTAPGERVAGTGWSLKGLHFEEFTLVADLTDDDDVVRVLSTRD